MYPSQRKENDKDDGGRLYLRPPDINPPDVPPIVTRVASTEYLQSPAVVWSQVEVATSLNPVTLFTNVSTAVPLNSSLECVDVKKLEEQVKELSTLLTSNDIVVVRGQHRVGKTSLMPVMAAIAPKTLLDAAIRDGKKARSVVTSKASSKFMIVVYDATEAALLRIHLKKLYPSVNIAVYFDISGRSPRDQTNTILPGGVNRDAMGDGMPEKIDGAICCPNAAITLMERGRFGTIFVEHVDKYNHCPSLAVVISRGCSMMKCTDEISRRLGRMVLISADMNPAEDVFISEMKTTADGHGLRVAEFTLVGRPGRAEASMAAHSSCFMDPTYTDERYLRNYGCTDTATMVKARDAVAPYITRTVVNGNFLTNDTASFVLCEREDRTTPTCPVPSFDFNKLLVFEVAKKALGHVLDRSGMGLKHRRDEDKKIETIVIVCSTVEQVQALGNLLKGCREFSLAPLRVADTHNDRHHVTPNNKPAFYTIRHSAGWKMSRDIYVPKDYSDTRYIINWSVYPRHGGKARVMKGQVAIMTPHVAEVAELKDVCAVIMSQARFRRGPYQTHGLHYSVSEFADASSIKACGSRVGRDGKSDGVFLYAGSSHQCNLRLDEDSRMEEFHHAATVIDVLFEEAPPDRFDVVKISHNPEAAKILADAEIEGFVSRSVDGDRVRITSEFARLANILPRIDLNTAAMVVMGTRMGIARHVIVLAALEMCGYRITQQAASTNPMANVHSYQCSVGELFEYVITHAMAHSTGGVLGGGLPPYGSEPVSAADLWSSFVVAAKIRSTDEEFSYLHYAGEQEAAAWNLSIPDTNFWRAIWSGGNARPSFRAPAAIQTQMYGATGNAFGWMELYKKNVKDEGRESFVQAFREISFALYTAHIVGYNDPAGTGFHSTPYNRHNFTKESPILSVDGRALLSGLLTMCGSKFGRYVGTRAMDRSITEMKSPDDTGLLPPRYEVFVRKRTPEELQHVDSKKMNLRAPDRDGDDHRYVVNGFTNRKPPTVKKFAAYTRSDAQPRDIRFYCPRIHPVSLHQMAVFGNAFGRWRFDSDRGRPILKVYLTGCWNEYQRLECKVGSKLAVHTEQTRNYLSGALKAALSINAPFTANPSPPDLDMDECADFIIKMWKFYDYIDGEDAPPNPDIPPSPPTNQ